MVSPSDRSRHTELLRLMSTVERALDEFETYIRRRIEDDRASHREVSNELQTLSSSGPIQSQRGFSVRSIQRFCHEKGIHKTSRLSAAAVEHVVSKAVAKVIVGICHHATPIGIWVM